MEDKIDWSQPIRLKWWDDYPQVKKVEFLTTLQREGYVLYAVKFTGTKMSPVSQFIHNFYEDGKSENYCIENIPNPEEWI